MSENLSNVSPARINELADKLDGKYGNEAARKLILIGQNLEIKHKQRKQELITILKEKREEFESKSKPCESNVLGNIIIEGNSQREAHYSALANKIDRILEAIRQNEVWRNSNSRFL